MEPEEGMSNPARSPEKSTLAAAGRPHDSHKLTLGNNQIDSSKNFDTV